MNNILNIEISIEELKGKIKEYYLSLDKSIKDINVEFSSEIKYMKHLNDMGEYISYPCGYKLQSNITLIYQQNIFGEDRKIEKKLDLNEDNITEILNTLLQRENLKIEYDIKYNKAKDSVSFSYTNIISEKEIEKERENEKFQEYYDEDNYLGVLFLLGDKTIRHVERKAVKTLKKCLNRF